MSVARIYTTQKSRKPWTCTKCRTVLPVGSRVLSFTVGFRGATQHRCDKPECRPLTSELESSLVASVYAAQEGVDLASCESLDEIESALEDVAGACDEVADEYESNEMYDVNYDLQERAEQVRSAGEELRSWDWDGDELPEGASADETEEWLEDVRASAQEAIDSMDLP